MVAVMVEESKFLDLSLCNAEFLFTKFATQTNTMKFKESSTQTNYVFSEGIAVNIKRIMENFEKEIQKLKEEFKATKKRHLAKEFSS